MHEAEFLCDTWPLKYKGFAPYFVQAAVTGPNFTSHWNYRFPDQSYLGLARTNIAAALAAQPGNFLPTAVWLQGESWPGNHVA
ncbi:MAG: hypothetical protein N4A53_02455 [Pelagimonas sp.]|jgi:hypothetical protein|nr:hypothetical protein [Pelagimonas sp.]